MNTALSAFVLLAASVHDRDRFKPDIVRSGTSYATPYIAGRAARLLELDPLLTPVGVEAKR